jgi:hypothetical protein
MKRLLIAIACLVFLSASALAQTADEPASRDDVILFLRTMHSHDLFQRTMEVQSQSMQQLFRDQIAKDKGSVPPDFAVHMKKVMDELMKNMPIDEVTQAMIPAYQNHFTKGDIEALNAFYSSPVGQKFLEESPAVMQEGMKAAMPILSKYLSEWKERMGQEVKQMENNSTPAEPAEPAKN